ncbi:MAG: hypothetical protein Q8R16_02105 [bacterium]|nr:hypothetical protein [bacterium]
MNNDKKMEGGGCCGGGGGGGKCGSGGCACVHHKMPVIAALLIAVAFLLGNLGYVSEKFVSLAWPILLGLGALMKLTGGKCKCC